MRNLFFSLLAGVSFFLTGCLETIQEVTIKEDGSGTISTTTDMSSMLGMLKQMGDEDYKKNMPGKLDTSFSLSNNIDEMQGLTESEKMLIKEGTMNMNIDTENEKMVIRILFPFSKVSDIPLINAVSGKIILDEFDKKTNPEASKEPAQPEEPKPSSLDAYFITEYDQGSIKCKINNEKYKSVESDEYLKGMKEAATMGMPMKTKYIFNLPRPVEEVEGDVVKLSEDKMKATIEFDIDDFFDNPGKLEYKIKY